MTRLIGTAILATAFAAAAVHAQDTTVKTTTTTERDGAKTITYTGCVQTAPETRSFTLDHIVPVSRTTVTESGGNGAPETTTTTTKYMLVPGGTVQFQQFVGHKVEVTGMLMPAGDSKTTRETTIERENGPDTKTTETVSRERMPEFRVMSIKHLADSCSN